MGQERWSRIIGCGALPGDGIGDDDEAMSDTARAAVIIVRYRRFFWLQVLLFYILFVEEITRRR